MPRTDFNVFSLPLGLDRIRRYSHRRVTMRDGVDLSADVTLPSGKGPFPAILLRTPYDNSREKYIRFAYYFAANGYAFVAQDVRGRGDSQGDWKPWFREGEDGYDTIEWVAAQPWCTGLVGTMGGSYEAQIQWMAAGEKPPHLAAMVPTASPGKWMEYGNPYQNGVPSLEEVYWCYMTQGHTLQTSPDAFNGVAKDRAGINWPEIMYHLPLETMDKAAGFYSPFWRFCIEHPDLDEYWYKLRLNDDFSSLEVPALHITGWFDDDLLSTTYNYMKMLAESKVKNKQSLVIGPWDHPGTRDPQQCLFGEDFGTQAVIDIPELHRQFFDCHLKSKAPFEHDARLFVLGRNEWQSAPTWPPDDTVQTSYFLDSGGAANSFTGDGVLKTDLAGKLSAYDRYLYDPQDPTPSWTDHRNRWGPQNLSLDQCFVQNRDDVLVYTGDTLDTPLTVEGTPVVELYISSNVQDTDFFVTLCDVYPDGRSIRLSWNVLRTRYRESRSEPKLMSPGTIYKLELELQPVCNVFELGHRIRVDIRSACFPIRARNLNTGNPIGKSTEMLVAHQTVYHDTNRPSCIRLPLVQDNKR